MKIKGLLLLGTMCFAAYAQSESLPPLQTVPQVDVLTKVIAYRM